MLLRYASVWTFILIRRYFVQGEGSWYFCQGEGHTISCSSLGGHILKTFYFKPPTPSPPGNLWPVPFFSTFLSAQVCGKVIRIFKSGESSGVVIVRNTLARSLGNATLTQRVYNITIISLTWVHLLFTNRNSSEMPKHLNSEVLLS